jgi:hypothetical protein
MASTHTKFKAAHGDNNYLNHIKRLPCEPSESPSQEMSETQTEAEGELAIEEFKREI